METGNCACASRNISCPECNHQFMIKIPQGVDQAVVECPACNTDFGIEFAWKPSINFDWFHSQRGDGLT